MKKLLSFLMSFFLVIGMAGCSQSHEEEIRQVVTSYFNIFKSGENLQDGDQYCTTSYQDSDGFAKLEEELQQEIDSQGLGDTFNEEARDFVKVCFQNFIVSYDIDSVEESKDSATVGVTINGINYEQFNFADYESQIEKVATDYSDAHMNEYVQIYQEQGEDAMEEKVYADISRVVFGEMKQIVTNFEKEEYRVIVQLTKNGDAWLIEAINFAE